MDKSIAKDYTQDPRYQEILSKEKDIIMGGKIRQGTIEGEGGKLTVRETVAAEKEAKQQYLQKVGTLSKDNAAAKETSSKPVIIQQSAPVQAPTPAPAPQTFMPRGGVRSTESAIERYSNRNAHFY